MAPALENDRCLFCRQSNFSHREGCPAQLGAPPDTTAKLRVLRAQLRNTSIVCLQKLADQKGARYVRRLELLFKAANNSASYDELRELDATIKEDAGRDARCPDCSVKSGRNHKGGVHQHTCSLLLAADGEFCIMPPADFVEGGKIL